MVKPERFTQYLTVESIHLDALDHVNNVHYLQWVQDIASAHWQARATDEYLHYKWVVLNHFIEYLKPVFEGDKIRIQTYVGETSGVRCKRFVEFFKDSTLVAKAESQWCMVYGDTLRPARIPDGMFQLFMTN